MQHLLAVLILALGFTLAPAATRAAEDAAQTDLWAALAPTSHLQGNFIQNQYGEDGVLLLQSRGRFAVLRPGYFSWEITSPDNQLIVADADYIWHHDRDLETVTRRPTPSGAEATPLQILGGDTASLRESFSVVDEGQGVYTLTPLVEGAGFRSLRLTLSGSLLTRMEVRDNLDQRIEVEFLDVDAQSALTPAAFDFTPPEGADVFLHDQ